MNCEQMKELESPGENKEKDTAYFDMNIMPLLSRIMENRKEIKQ